MPPTINCNIGPMTMDNKNLPAPREAAGDLVTPDVESLHRLWLVPVMQATCDHWTPRLVCDDPKGFGETYVCATCQKGELPHLVRAALHELQAENDRLREGLAYLGDAVNPVAEARDAAMIKLEAAEQATRALTAENALLRQKAADWNTEADRYLNQRDHLETESVALRTALRRGIAELPRYQEHDVVELSSQQEYLMLNQVEELLDVLLTDNQSQTTVK